MAGLLSKEKPKQKTLLGGNLPMGLLSSGNLSSYTPTLREKIISAMARNWYGDSREGYQQAGNLMKVADMTPVGIATGMYDAGRLAGQGNYAQAGLGVAMAGAPIPPALKKGIRAYHGSPHSFDKFSMDKIGTGEGAQAYGHGLYFAEGEGVAKSYRDALTDPQSIPLQYKGRPVDVIWDDGIAERWNDVISALPPQQADDFKVIMSNLTQVNNMADVKNVLASLTPSQRNTYQRFVAPELTKPDVPKGHMYEVNIDADPDQFLDWDKPLSEQPENVRSLLGPGLSPQFKERTAFGRKRLEIDLPQGGGISIDMQPDGARVMQGGRDDVLFRSEEEAKKYVSDLFMNELPTGGSAVKRAFDNPLFGGDLLKKDTASRNEVSKYLAEKGIPGIKYLDAGSRAKGDGSRNYVVFDENLISIVRKYGIAGASAMLGYDLLANTDPAQAAQLKQIEGGQ